MQTPESYPADCELTQEEYDELRETLTDPDNEDWISYVEQWPPTDHHGNVFPLWFTADEFVDDGKIVDKNGNPFNPFSGNLDPILGPDEDERCNTPLRSWKTRYPSIRYCGQIIENYVKDTDYCYYHKGRRSMSNRKTAEEQLQTGFHTKTVDHLYGKLDPWQRLFGWGVYESLLGESTKEFGVEYTVREFDFSDEPMAPDGVDDDGTIEIRCGYPTDHLDASLSLYVAAMMSVQMITVQPRIMYENEDEGERMMETKSIETAQLTAPPSEHDQTPQQFKTLETWSEHHLNLPLSRLVNDRKKLLERGGVDMENDSDDNDIEADEIVLEIDADADDVATKDNTSDPNQFEGGIPESQRIKESVQGGD